MTYPLKYPRLYREGVAAEAVKGVLLFGPPGKRRLGRRETREEKRSSEVEKIERGRREVVMMARKGSKWAF